MIATVASHRGPRSAGALWSIAHGAWILVGMGVIALALASALTLQAPERILDWFQDQFGLAFTLPYLGLIAVACVAIARLAGTPQSAFHRELGLQAASGIATLALTFTLLGIALGVGGLAEREVNPDTVQAVIADLTGHFSVAFMTTVVGLPTAAILRAAVVLVVTRHETEA